MFPTVFSKKNKKSAKKANTPPKRVGLNGILTLLIFAFVGVSCYMFVAGSSPVYNPLASINIYEYLIGSDSALVFSIVSAFSAVDPATFFFSTNFVVLIVKTVEALFAILFALHCVYALLAAIVDFATSRTDRLFSVLSGLVAFSIRLIVVSTAFDLLSFGDSRIASFITGYGPGVGVLATALAGLVLLIVFGVTERVRAKKLNVSSENLAISGNLFRAFFGHLFIIVASCLLKINVFLLMGVSIIGTFAEKAIAGTFDTFVLLNGALFVLYAIFSFAILFRATKNLSGSISGALAVNAPVKESEEDIAVGKKFSNRKKIKRSCGFIKYVFYALLTVGGMAYMMFFQTSIYDASALFKASALMIYAILCGAIAVISIIFQILSHFRVKKSK